MTPMAAKLFAFRRPAYNTGGTSRFTTDDYSHSLIPGRSYPHSLLCAFNNSCQDTQTCAVGGGGGGAPVFHRLLFFALNPDIFVFFRRLVRESSI